MQLQTNFVAIPDFNPMLLSQSLYLVPTGPVVNGLAAFTLQSEAALPEAQKTKVTILRSAPSKTSKMLKTRLRVVVPRIITDKLGNAVVADYCTYEQVLMSSQNADNAARRACFILGAGMTNTGTYNAANGTQLDGGVTDQNIISDSFVNGNSLY